MTPIVITPPAGEPITLAQAKAHLRVVTTDEDSYIETLITAARQMVEERTQRAMMPQVIAIGVDAFCSIPALPRPPFIGPGVTVKYFDEDGAETTLPAETYNVNRYVEPARVTLAADQTWPTTNKAPGGVTLTYEVGYADADSVPAPLKQWMLLCIGAMYENREENATGTEIYSIPKDFMGLLWQPYMVYA